MKTLLAASVFALALSSQTTPGAPLGPPNPKAYNGSLTYSIVPSPTVSPVVALAGAGAGNTTNGVYTTGYAYRTAAGYTYTSAFNDGGTTVTVTDATTNGQIAVSGLTDSSDGTVLDKVYCRSKHDAANILYVVAVIQNGTTTYTDNTADASLTVVCPVVNTTGGVFSRGTNLPVYTIDEYGGLNFATAFDGSVAITVLTIWETGFQLDTLPAGYHVYATTPFKIDPTIGTVTTYAAYTAVGLGLAPILGTARQTGKTTAITTTNLIASVTTNAMFHVDASLLCTTTSAAATVNITIGWTDDSNTAQTSTLGSAVACTALGASSFGTLNFNLSAKAGTAITYATSIVNTPTYNVRVTVKQETVN